MMFHTNGIHHSDHFLGLVHVIIKFGDVVGFCHMIDPSGKSRHIMAFLSLFDQSLESIKPQEKSQGAVQIALDGIIFVVLAVMVPAFFTRKDYL